MTDHVVSRGGHVVIKYLFRFDSLLV